MLGKQLTLSDMEAVDPEYYNSLLWIRSVCAIYFIRMLHTLCTVPTCICSGMRCSGKGGKWGVVVMVESGVWW